MSRAAGFTLIEILIAVLVLAVGLIGASAMQLHALRTRHESALLSAAVRIAAGMAERMRANAALVSTTYVGTDYDARAVPVPPAPGNQCLDTPCDAAQIAALDIHDLQRQVGTLLPGGRARICRDGQAWSGDRLRWACDGATGAPVVVKVGWRGRQPGGTPDPDLDEPGVAVAVAGVAP
jgi:type IV pilus assembly protein PilV